MKLMSFEQQVFAGFGAVIDACSWGLDQAFNGLYASLNESVQRNPIAD